jgi:aquacobalamin reductase/NAD(P)H-flavin reductase
MSEVQCKVTSITPLTSVVFKVELTPLSPITFNAGQYVLVHMGENDQRPFSIANAAFDNHRIELHIGAGPNNSFASEVLEKMQQDKTITISGGLGEAYLRATQLPMILIAGGTGFSYVYSILQQALHSDPNTHVTLYWGGRHEEDLYYREKLNAMAAQHPHFTFIPVVEFAQDDWQGRTGWVHHAVLADYADLSNYQVYIAGRFEMAKVAREEFTARHLATENLFGDAFAYI